MSSLRARLGNAGEREAEAFLRRHGLTLIQKNYRCRGGEIDLVMRDVDDGIELLVFVEVRLRGAGARVSALESVDRNKQRKLITAARHFLMEYPDWNEHPCRFDVVALDTHQDRLMWLPAAFETG